MPLIPRKKHPSGIRYISPEGHFIYVIASNTQVHRTLALICLVTQAEPSIL